jgi:hypothetical protein
MLPPVSPMLRVSEYALWIVLPILQSAIGHRMWTRRLYRDYPLFFAYTIEQLVRFSILFYYYQLGTRDGYRHAYFSLEALEAVLQLAVICELFFHVFRPYEGIRELALALLRWAGVILLLIAVVVAASSSGADTDRILAGFFAMERSLEIVQGGLLFLLFVLSASLGLRWQQPTLGIALGFGIFTSVDLAAFTLRAQLGMSSHQVLSLIANAGFDCAVLIWLATLYSRRPVRQFKHYIPSWDVELWNQALLDLLRR